MPFYPFGNRLYPEYMGRNLEYFEIPVIEPNLTVWLDNFMLHNLKIVSPIFYSADQNFAGGKFIYCINYSEDGENLHPVIWIEFIPFTSLGKTTVKSIIALQIESFQALPPSVRHCYVELVIGLKAEFGEKGLQSTKSQPELTLGVTQQGKPGRPPIPDEYLEKVKKAKVFIEQAKVEGIKLSWKDTCKKHNIPFDSPEDKTRLESAKKKLRNSKNTDLLPG